MLIKIYLKKPLANFNAITWIRRYLLLYRHDIADKSDLKDDIARLNKSIKGRVKLNNNLRRLQSKIDFIVRKIEESPDSNVLEKNEELKKHPGPHFEYSET